MSHHDRQAKKLRRKKRLEQRPAPRHYTGVRAAPRRPPPDLIAKAFDAQVEKAKLQDFSLGDLPIQNCVECPPLKSSKVPEALAGQQATFLFERDKAAKIITGDQSQIDDLRLMLEERGFELSNGNIPGSVLIAATDTTDKAMMIVVPNEKST